MARNTLTDEGGFKPQWPLQLPEMWPNIEWGGPVSWAEALASLGTLAAVLLGLGVALWEVRQSRRQREAARAEHRRRQATQVTAWREVEWIESREQYGDGWWIVRYEVRNASSLPVYDVSGTPLARAEADAAYIGENDEQGDYPEPPWLYISSDAEAKWRWNVAVVSPEKPLQWRVLPKDRQQLRNLVEPVAITFRDASGIWWRRDDAGNVRELRQNPYPDSALPWR